MLPAKMKHRRRYPGKTMHRIIVLFIAVCIYKNSTAQNSHIKCYFNHPVNNAISTGMNAVYLNGKFPDTIAAYINRAKFTIDVAMYNFTSSTFSSERASPRISISS